MMQIIKFNIITIFLFTNIQAREISRRQTSQIQEQDRSIIKGINNSSENIINHSSKLAEVFHVTNSTEKHVTGKKWQVGKVSRKQYEIVNMLWRKTNVFNDEVGEDTTETIKAKGADSNINKNNKWMSPITFANIVRPSKSFKQSTTPSYIEFYYLDETINQTIRNRDQSLSPVELALSKRTASNNFKINSRLPFFVFHINEPTIAFMPPSYTVKKPTPVNIVDYYTNSYANSKVSAIALKLSINESHKVPINFLQQSHLYPVSSVSSNSDATSKSNLFSSSNNYKVLKKPSAFDDAKYTVDNISNTYSTKVYDRIKFFEIYDSNTLEPKKNGKKPIDYDDDENIPDTNDLDSENKILLAHIDKDLKHTEEVSVKKYEKKHVKSYEFENKPPLMEEFVANISVVSLNSSESISTESIVQRQQFFNNNHSVLTENNSSRCASWSEYPFVAVYVYELYRIYCDAAIISPHWLLASGSCLSQHRVKDTENSRSAYVTYCGNNWWDPERITYVKSCSIHPRYNTMDSRKYIYNIGLIQVISSMASACNNWNPVSLMSHQFGTEPDGSLASAVGWGLDRFITRPITDLPRSPLTVFEGKVFSNSCPGNSVYQRLHYLSREGTKNIYCLLLPPYTGEERDAVHGGLLLVGGQLIALFLQEERRHFGFQSAMYTGIWKLVPWINRVAREPEEADFLV